MPRPSTKATSPTAIAANGAPAASSGAKRAAPVPRIIENLQDLNFLHLLYFWVVARDGSIATACQKLQLTQPTISMQIRKLEKTLGHKLFERSGRNLVLSEIGRTVYDYADDIFSTGRELLGALRGMPIGRSTRLHVGVPMFLPKTVTYRLLEPVLHGRQQVQLVCHESSMESLVSDFARHKFDCILSDTPLSMPHGSKSYAHPLGECGVVICGVRTLASRYRSRFPASLDGAPFLLPAPAADMRRSLDRWFDSQHFSPWIVGEFDDSALMKEFGGGGAGLFPMPAAVLKEVRRQYDVELVGRLPGVRARYYAITTERKLTHPALVVIAETARSGLLAERDE